MYIFEFYIYTIKDRIFSKIIASNFNEAKSEAEKAACIEKENIKHIELHRIEEITIDPSQKAELSVQ